MPAKLDKFSLTSHGLKRKLNVSFCLMSILPILVCLYLVSDYILPPTVFKIDVTAIILISILIAFVGFLVIKEVFDRIMSVTSEAKLIAAGDLSRRLKVKHTDEVGDLGDALNQLTLRIRSNMDELKSYGEKTTEINMEIQRRVIVLSSLLQISSLISQSSKLEDTLKIIVEKSRLLANSDVAYLLFRDEGQDNFYMKAADGINSEFLLKINVEPEEAFFSKTININKPLILDKDNVLAESVTGAFYEKFRLKNALAMPVYFRGRAIGILGIGNTRDSFLYKKDDVELLDIFTKQIAIAVHNDILTHRVEKLEIKDALTGLYNEAFIRSRLQEEIKRAIRYQRPCAFILINIDNFKKFHTNFGSLQAEAIVKKIASLVSNSVTDIDRVGRTGDDEFAVILPERNKRQAQEIARDIRKRVESAFSEEKDGNKKITISGGVSENPLDGVDAEQLFSKAKQLLKHAKDQGRNRIVSIIEPPVCH